MSNARTCDQRARLSLGVPVPERKSPLSGAFRQERRRPFSAPTERAGIPSGAISAQATATFTLRGFDNGYEKNKRRRPLQREAERELYIKPRVLNKSTPRLPDRLVSPFVATRERKNHWTEQSLVYMFVLCWTSTSEQGEMSALLLRREDAGMEGVS